MKIEIKKATLQSDNLWRKVHWNANETWENKTAGRYLGKS